jgi:hypothetical protein
MIKYWAKRLRTENLTGCYDDMFEYSRVIKQMINRTAAVKLRKFCLNMG